MSNRPWPDGDATLPFSELVKPVCAAIRRAYRLERVDRDSDVPWNGPELPESMRAADIEYDKRLTAKGLAFDLDDQGREAIEVIVGIAIQLGIEQGRRLICSGQDVVRELRSMRRELMTAPYPTKDDAKEES